MTYEIKTRKSYDGSWRAESHAKLGETTEGTRLLELCTYKVRGGLAAHANVFIYKEERGFTSKSTEIFGDFSKSGIAFTECKRVTEKALVKAHKLALLEMDNLIVKATAFYKNKDNEANA